jgi:hypothetical protein
MRAGLGAVAGLRAVERWLGHTVKRKEFQGRLGYAPRLSWSGELKIELGLAEK